VTGSTVRSCFDTSMSLSRGRCISLHRSEPFVRFSSRGRDDFGCSGFLFSPLADPGRYFFLPKSSFWSPLQSAGLGAQVMRFLLSLLIFATTGLGPWRAGASCFPSTAGSAVPDGIFELGRE